MPSFFGVTIRKMIGPPHLRQVSTRRLPRGLSVGLRIWILRVFRPRCPDGVLDSALRHTPSAFLLVRSRRSLTSCLGREIRPARRALRSGPTIRNYSDVGFVQRVSRPEFTSQKYLIR